MESLCDLLFEVSNEERMRILHRLEEGGMTITSLSRALDITTQEASRHVSRLGEVGLTVRDPEGHHSLTPYGRLTLRQIRGVEFTSLHRDYFKAHTLAALPTEYVGRIGELAGSALTENVMVTIHSIEETIQEAEEYLLNINVPYIASAFPLIRESIERGVKARFLHTRDLVLPEIMRDDRDQTFSDQILAKARRSGIYEERLIDEIDLVLYMSERRVAVVTFPQEDGDFDFLGFTSTDEAVHRWCSDVFQHYWERATPVGNTP
jgi:predicted transcriptional regulator